MMDGHVRSVTDSSVLGALSVSVLGALSVQAVWRRVSVTDSVSVSRPSHAPTYALRCFAANSRMNVASACSAQHIQLSAQPCLGKLSGECSYCVLGLNLLHEHFRTPLEVYGAKPTCCLHRVCMFLYQTCVWLTNPSAMGRALTRTPTRHGLGAAGHGKEAREAQEKGMHMHVQAGGLSPPWK